MERIISANLLVAPVVLAMLFILMSTTTATMATTYEERQEIVIEEVMIVEQPKTDINSRNRKTKMMFMQPNNDGLLDAEIIKEVVTTNNALKCGVQGEPCGGKYTYCCSYYRCYGTGIGPGICTPYNCGAVGEVCSDSWSCCEGTSCVSPTSGGKPVCTV